MRFLLAVLVVAISTVPAHADFFYKLAGYECNTNANALIITYVGGDDGAGKKMMRNRSPRQWDPWSLVVKKRNYISSHKTVHGQCVLGDGVYEISIGPLPGNANLQGKCGGFMSAWVEVRRDSDVVLPRHEFEFGDCHVAQPVTTKITIEAGGKEPVIEKVPWDRFYGLDRDP